MTLDRPLHAPETADGTTAPTVTAPLAPGISALGGIAQKFTPPPDFTTTSGIVLRVGTVHAGWWPRWSGIRESCSRGWASLSRT